MGFFKTIPRDLEDAAMVDGLTRFGAFLKLVVPISISGVLTVVIFTFTLVTQEFVYALTFISGDKNQVVQVGVPIFLVPGDVYLLGFADGGLPDHQRTHRNCLQPVSDRFVAGFTVGAVK